MNNLRYTNIVLTVIAVCLIIIAGRGSGIVREASAQSSPKSKPPEPQRVIISAVERKDGLYYFPEFAFNGAGSLLTFDTAPR
jgi:hypothetical protein